jgi:serpin B
MLAGLMLYVDRPGTAAPLVLLAVVNVVVFLVVEPASETVSFPNENRPGEAGEPVQLREKQPVTQSSGTQHADGSDGFALAMYALLRERSGNVVFSPFSVRLALQVALAGARGDTATQMRAALRLHSAGDLQEDDLPTMLERFRGGGGELGLAVANGVWTQEGQALLAEFRELVSRRFRAEVRLVDFRHAAERARLAINGWVSEQTRDRIRDLVPPRGVDPETRLVLANAIWFKDRWALPFDRMCTRHARFYLDTRKTVQAPLMYQRASVAYARGDGFQAVDLAYDETTCSMLILLPDARNGLRDLEVRLSVGLLRECVAGLRLQEVELFLPRFRMEPRTVELGPLLSGLGIRLAFSPASADFSGINGLVPPDPDALYVSAVLHQAFVEADESGTEAAAATAALLGPTAALHPALPPPVPVFRADHPFLFAIRDRRSGVLLFLGRVADPTMPTARE